jgi:hypothetical protein
MDFTEHWACITHGLRTARLPVHRAKFF